MNIYSNLTAFLCTFLCSYISLSTSKSLNINNNNDDHHHHHHKSIHSSRPSIPEYGDEYDLVNVRLISKRSADINDDSMKIHLNVFGKDMNLNLQPNTDFSDRIKDMKVFMASTTSNGEVKYSEDFNSKELPDLGKPYHDSTNMAAVIVSHDPEGRLQMDGTLGNDLIIKPMPSTVSEVVDDDYRENRDDDEMFLDDDFESNNDNSASKSGLNNSNKFNSSSLSDTRPRILNRENAPTSTQNGDDDNYSIKYSPHYNIPKLTTGSGKQKSFDNHKNTHIVYKKARHQSEHHSDYLELEPGISLITNKQQPDIKSNNIFNSSSSTQPFVYTSSSASNLRASFFPSSPSSSSSSSSSSSYKPATSSSYQTMSADDNYTNHGDSSINSDPKSHHRRAKREAPDTVWPEVLLVVDYDSYMLHGGNSRDVKRYFISFWNGVDLRYKLLSHPTIRVSLAGMIVAKDRDATPYLERNRLRPPNADAVDAAGALTDMGKYLYREDRLPTYDLAVVITKLDMCRRRYEGGRCNRGTAGFAYVGGACVVNKRLEKVNSVAIIEDSGGFSGIIVAAHEVGHLLGCVHDGSPPPSYLGGPGATRCPWEDGFIMSDLRHTERGFRWSSCSVEQFKHFLNGETATCLYNYPHENQLLPRVLPGTMLTLDEQCKRDRGTNACFKDARVCAQLFCFDSASGYCVSYRPAAEGSPCGDSQVCRNGKCTAELENIIPDYTHVTQTISRSNSAGSEESVPSISRRSSHRADTRFRNRQGVLRPTTEHNNHLVTPASRQAKSIMDNECRDNVAKIGGSMSCPQFLEKYAYRYCNHDYVKRNCCASHAVLCSTD